MRTININLHNSERWICNVKRKNKDKVLSNLKSVLNELQQKIGESIYRIRIMGRNPNRKQFKRSYKNTTSGPTQYLRVKDASYFSLYLGYKSYMPPGDSDMYFIANLLRTKLLGNVK